MLGRLKIIKAMNNGRDNFLVYVLGIPNFMSTID